MSKQTNSFQYTRDVLSKLMEQAHAEVARMGGNKGVEKILAALVVKDDEGSK
jgi:geranylgeranyl diphosphate synthase type 3